MKQVNSFFGKNMDDVSQKVAYFLANTETKHIYSVNYAIDSKDYHRVIMIWE